MSSERNNISNRMRAAADMWRADTFRALELDTGSEVQKMFGRCQSKIAATKLAMSLVETLVAEGNSALAFDVAWEFSEKFLDKKDPQKLRFLERMIQISVNEQHDLKAYNLITQATETAALQGRYEDAQRFSTMSVHLEIG